MIVWLRKCPKGAKQAKLVGAMFKLTERGDENFETFVRSGGIGVLVKVLEDNLDDPGAMLLECLHFVGELSSNKSVQTVLTMQNVVGMMLRCMRKNTKVLTSS